MPAGQYRDAALERIESLDCASSDERLASCHSKAWLAPLHKAWRNSLEAARVNDADYAVTLAKALRELVCSGGDVIHVVPRDEAIYVVRGFGFQDRLKGGFGFQDRLTAAGAAASKSLIKDLTNKDSKACPVAASLTDADRAKLLQIKQEIEAAEKPGG